MDRLGESSSLGRWGGVDDEASIKVPLPSAMVRSLFNLHLHSRRGFVTRLLFAVILAT